MAGLNNGTSGLYGGSPGLNEGSLGLYSGAAGLQAGGGGAAPVGIPTISPSVSYNGTQLSGGTPPVDPARVSDASAYGKPAISWIYGYRGMRVADGDRLMGVEAECVGGVKHVVIWFEGNTITVKRSKQSVYNPSKGANENRVGYWFYLRVPVGQRGANNIARVFATAVPNNPLMQSRTLGWSSGGQNSYLVPADTAVTGYRAPVAGEDYRPMWVYPRATLYDAVKNVRADGLGDYLTLRAALNACNTAMKATPQLCWDFVLHDANNDIGIPDSFVNRDTGWAGYNPHRIRAKTGVNARIYKGASFDKYNTLTLIPADFAGTFNNYAWDGLLGINNFELYGGSNGTSPDGATHGRVILDFANIANIILMGNWANVVLNGCHVTNTQFVSSGNMFHVDPVTGVPGSVSRNTGISVGIMSVNNPADVSVSLIYTTFEYVNFSGQFQDYGVKRVNGLVNISNQRAVVESYSCGFDGTYQIAYKPAIRVTYTGGAANANYRISKPGGANADSFLELLEGGSVTASVSLRNPNFFVDPVIGTAPTGQSVHTMQQLATWISAQTGWGATLPAGGEGITHCSWMLNKGSVDYGTFTTTDIKAATASPGYYTGVAWYDSHNEAFHPAAYSGGFENYLLLRNIEIQSHWSTGHLFTEGSGASSNLIRDFITAQHLVWSSNQSYQEIKGFGGPGNGNGASIVGSHAAAINITGGSPGWTFSISDLASGSNLIGNSTGVINSIGGMGVAGPYGTGFATTSTFKMNNNAHSIPAGPGFPPNTAPYGSANITYASNAARDAYFINTALAVQDYRPAPGGVLASNKIAYSADLQAYDAFWNAYSTSGTDYIGAVSQNSGSAFVRPLATFSESTYPTI